MGRSHGSDWRFFRVDFRISCELDEYFLAAIRHALVSLWEMTKLRKNWQLPIVCAAGRTKACISFEKQRRSEILPTFALEDLRTTQATLRLYIRLHNVVINIRQMAEFAWVLRRLLVSLQGIYEQSVIKDGLRHLTGTCLVSIQFLRCNSHRFRAACGRSVDADGRIEVGILFIIIINAV